MANLIKTQAIILKKKEILEKDMVITLLTYEHGKMRAIAKGVKKITSRRSPHVQTGNLVNVVLSKSDTTYYLQQSDLISGFTAIKDSPEKLEFLYTFFFIIDRISPEEQQETGLFDTVKSFLVELARNGAASSLLEKYLYRVLTILGYLHEPRPLDDLIRMTEEIINEKVPTDVII